MSSIRRRHAAAASALMSVLRPTRITAGEPLHLIESAERFFAATGATFRHGGNMAYYAPGPDLIQLPPPEAFRDAESYAAIKSHELCHNAAPRIMPRRMSGSWSQRGFRRGIIRGGGIMGVMPMSA